jgi:hypothetical protein
MSGPTATSANAPPAAAEAAAAPVRLTPEALPAALADVADDTLVVVDFDETLFLRNSTELFLDSAQPAVLAAVLSHVVGFVKPWRFNRRYADGFAMGDWLRVLLVVCCFPWIVWRWRALAPSLAKAYLNPELATLLANRRFSRLVVASHGFSFIIEPLLKAMQIRAELVACPLWTGFAGRAAGKRAALEQRFGKAALASAVVITDHAENDADILAVAAAPLVVVWPEARYERAFSRTYVPLVYTEKAKHPTHSHLFAVYFAKDWAALVIASALLAPNPLLTALGLAFLIVSFGIIYEIGYHENDVLGRQREIKPVLTAERLALAGTVPEGQAWLFGALVALPGAWLLAWSESSAFLPMSGDLVEGTVLLLSLWLALLSAIRATFWLFNRIDERSRMLVFLPLQLMKGILLVLALGLPLSMAGAALLIAIAFATWIPYIVYRMGGARWESPDDVNRVFILLVMVVGFGSVTGFEPLLHWHTAVVFAWAILKARRHALRVWSQMHFLPDRVVSQGPGEGTVVARERVVSVGGLQFGGQQ